MNRFSYLVFGLFFISLSSSFACTSYLVSSGASKDGSCMISYAGDSHVRYGQLYFYPRAKWTAGQMQNIYDRSSGKLLGQIPYPAETYQVIGFMNEFQVSIGESTFGGRSELSDKLGILDWGSIMFATLQRSKTAREAVKNMVTLLNEYGYYSDGQSYSIADANEVWIIELIGKGENLKLDKKTGKNINLNKGVVFVARRVPDGYISAHANHSRITNFPLEDGRISITNKNLDKINNPDIEVVYSHDIIDFARKMKFFEGNDADFSFSQAYAPLDFGAARFCELRVWAMFNEVSDEMHKYWEYATGNAKEPRIPLFIKPNRNFLLEI
jgi:dipeptidase